MKGKGLKNAARILVVVLMPVFLGFATITWLISPSYPRFEYGRLDFPPDPYGLTQAERLDLALTGVAYLQRWEPAEEAIYMLREQTLPGGQLLYSEAEIQHMQDVKQLTDFIRMGSLLTGLFILMSMIMLLARPEARIKGYRAMLQSGLLTTILLSTLAVFILFGWPIFFRTFHEVLFPPGTWTFDGSSGLIRLFPERFWFDYGMLVTSAVLIEGFGLILASLLLALISKRKSEKQANVIVAPSSVQPRD